MSTEQKINKESKASKSSEKEEEKNNIQVGQIQPYSLKKSEQPMSLSEGNME